MIMKYLNSKKTLRLSLTLVLVDIWTPCNNYRLWCDYWYSEYHTRAKNYYSLSNASKNSRQWNVNEDIFFSITETNWLQLIHWASTLFETFLHRFSKSGLASSLLVQVWFYVLKVIGLFYTFFPKGLINRDKQGYFCKASRNDKRELARSFSLGNEQCAREWVTRAGKKEII